MGGSRTDKPWKTYRNILAVWTLTGLWHGFELKFLLWGLMNFILVASEHLFEIKERSKLWNTKHVFLYQFFIVVTTLILWVVFYCPNLLSAGRYIKAMFTFANKNSLSLGRTLLLIHDYAFFLVLGILFCFPVKEFFDVKVETKGGALKTIYSTINSVLLIGIFIISLGFVISGQNNPFVYAMF